MAFHTFDPVTVREGPVTVKKAGLLSSWRGWTEKWMVLKATSLTIQNRFSPESAVRVSLNSITRLERTHSSRKGHCLLLDAAGSRYLLAFQSDHDLYNWHDDIYSNSPLMLFRAGESTEIDLENIISGYSSSPDLSSRPSSPSTLPIKTNGPLPPPPLSRSYTHSPASSRQFLLDLEDLRGNPQPVEPVPAPSKRGLRTEERELIRKAVSLLCNLMEPRLLRKSEPGGEKPFDLVEIRLRSLYAAKRKWRKREISQESDLEEKQTFSDALRDGYVLCQLLNTLHSSPIVRPDVRGQDYNSSLNITKFLAACVAHGLPQSDLFLPLDLIEASSYSLARVAGTIIALVQFSDSSPCSATPPKALPGASREDISAIQRATEDLEEWVEHFIALTRQKMISDRLVNGLADESVGEQDAEFSNTKVYQHLISFITQAEAYPVWSLVQSSQFRVKMLKVKHDTRQPPSSGVNPL
ncbi:hypothetical protein FB451DRAFT_111678 [Mycena latifolia]|nr:hypothetical protein FB451DRAFT_111678 [Mycena latifolia]